MLRKAILRPCTAGIKISERAGLDCVVPHRPRTLIELVREVQACFACDGMAHAHVLGAANGPLDADVLFVAEAVGRRGGAVTGVPLTRDESGRRFARFLDLAGLERDRCFITNAVLCNPIDGAGRNRAPTPAEVARCRPFLARALEIVPAPVVVALGRVALESLRAIDSHDAQLPADRVVAQPWRGRTLVALYHPSRQSTLHRPEDAQVRDWCELGEIVRATTAITPSRAPR